MTVEDKSIKNIIKYGLCVIIPLIIASIGMGLYSLYISLLNNINNIPNVKTPEEKRSEDFGKNIKRLSYLKYTHENKGSDSSIYLIEIVKIGKCKYIILSKKDQGPVILHAYDCDNPDHKKM